jgi:hypothetical protein
MAAESLMRTVVRVNTSVEALAALGADFICARKEDHDQPCSLWIYSHEAAVKD